MQVKVKKINNFKGTIEVPPDKSISHRSVMLGSLCKGKVAIKNFSKGEDCRNTLKIFEQMGVNVKFQDEMNFEISSNGLTKPENILYAGNSGTTTRLLSGILAGQNFESRIEGDISLSQRPMKRIIEPLKLMHADISSLNNDFKTPLIIKPSDLHGIDYITPIASAQVKSCILFAGLFADGKTTVTEPYISRNHSEKMLEYLGANISVNNKTVKIEKSELIPKELIIPGDISSAAFFFVAASIIPNASIIVRNVGINETRTGIIDVLIKMGANLEILNKRTGCGEEVSDIKISYSENLKGIDISGEIIPRLIDELPIIAVLASQAEGQTIIKDAQDLRNKESDRIKSVVREFSKLGVDIEEREDGFIISGKTKLKGDTIIETYHDHRLAMSAYVAGLICAKEICINDFEWVNTSFPEFLELMNILIEE
ncbi:MAG: 3-phosphoshikimate 1-carboxyvinyltransferase [Candidatus Gastranaerophilales bacterium]|nr:3-phosphoshikimate 1-carboxyvinyltransferase [Candidatus Gastranaerophilales bacterium]